MDFLTLFGLLAVTAMLVGTIGMARPRWLAPIFMAWMWLTYPLAWLISNLILAIMFFAVLTPLGLIFHLVGRDALDRSWRIDQDSYWQSKPAAETPERYLRQ